MLCAIIIEVRDSRWPVSAQQPQSVSTTIIIYPL